MRGSSCSVISGTGAPAARFTRIATTGLGIPGGISSREYIDKLLIYKDTQLMRGSSCSVISGTGAPAARFTRIATTGLGIPGGISSREYMDKLPINYLDCVPHLGRA